SGCGGGRVAVRAQSQRLPASGGRGGCGRGVCRRRPGEEGAANGGDNAGSGDCAAHQDRAGCAAGGGELGRAERVRGFALTLPPRCGGSLPLPLARERGLAARFPEMRASPHGAALAVAGGEARRHGAAPAMASPSLTPPRTSAQLRARLDAADEGASRLCLDAAQSLRRATSIGEWEPMSADSGGSKPAAASQSAYWARV